jgi:hypothetical protein
MMWGQYEMKYRMWTSVTWYLAPIGGALSTTPHESAFGSVLPLHERM